MSHGNPLGVRNEHRVCFLSPGVPGETVVVVVVVVKIIRGCVQTLDTMGALINNMWLFQPVYAFQMAGFSAHNLMIT